VEHEEGFEGGFPPFKKTADIERQRAGQRDENDDEHVRDRR